MAEGSLVIDAWIREAQEVSIMVEDIESRIKIKDLSLQPRLRDNAQSKLLDAGVKLDRLESLLHNPPSKPILTKEDLEFRWKMLSDLRLRTRSLALSFYSKRARDFSAANPEGISKPINSYDQDNMKPFFCKDDPEMLKPLISEEASESSSDEAIWFWYSNKCAQEAELDPMFDSWRRCSYIPPDYCLFSSIICVLFQVV